MAVPEMRPSGNIQMRPSSSLGEMVEEACKRLERNCPLLIAKAQILPLEPHQLDNVDPDQEYRIIRVDIRGKANFSLPEHELAGRFSHSIEDFGTSRLFINTMTKIEFQDGCGYIDMEVSF